jgi:oligopeptide transport system permease protein
MNKESESQARIADAMTAPSLGIEEPQPTIPADALEDPAPQPVPDLQTVSEERSLMQDAWITMRSRPLFWISAALIFVFLLMAAFPQLFVFSGRTPDWSDLDKARMGPDSVAIFGYDLQGQDIYVRTIYGARASILVGVCTALGAAVIGVVLGTLGGFIGRFLDTLLSRTADVFFAIPLLLGGILIMYTFRTTAESPYFVVVFKVVMALSVLGWPNVYRLMRSSVMQVKPSEYVMAAKALGANPLRIIGSHIIPNAIAPVIVVSTIDLGSYIATEATLSYLGIGLQAPAISWGIAISDASAIGYVRNAPHMLLFPSLFLSLTVLAFIMMGEVVRDAMDPKLR